MLPPVRALPVRKENTNSTKGRSSVDVSNAESVNLKVVVRLRPPNDSELSSGKVNLIKPVDNHMLTFDPKEDEWTNINAFPNNKSRPGTDKKIKDLTFAFDRVFDGKSTNQEVFESTTKSAVESVLKGLNCSVFAYGATSAGKTHTMLGTPEEPGVIYLTMMELYRRLMSRKNDYDGDISVSYLEIYNEMCKDLLLPKGPLAVREDPEKGVCVSGLSLHKPKSAEELLEMLHYGNQNRTQHPTDANKQSSRSHAVFQVFVRQAEKASGLNTKVTFAKMSLIDLAGSERATVTTNQGDRLREGANINKSLLALGNCINALAENKSKAHIPYRDSKLTRLLKDSLGGNCETIMIAAVSPSVLSYEDTYNTLKYADRAKKIKASLTVNNTSVDVHISQYGKIVEVLKSEIADLKLKIKQGNSIDSKFDVDGTEKEFIDDPPTNKDSDQMIIDLQGYEKQLYSLYKERCSYQQNLVVSESTGKELSLKLLQKERSHKRLEHISEIAGSVPRKAQEKLDKFRHSYETKQAFYLKQKVTLTSSLDENMLKLDELKSEINDWANKSDSFMITRLTGLLFEFKQLELKYVGLKAQYKHLRKQLPLQETENRSNEQLIVQLLQIIASQQRKLNIQMNTDVTNTVVEDVDVDIDIQDLPNQLVGDTKIAWADQTFTMDGCNNTYVDVSPFKTPSKKPYVLRQIISESRRTSEETHRNTLFNAQPMKQSVTPLQSYTNDVGNKLSLRKCVSLSNVLSNNVHQPDLNGTFNSQPMKESSTPLQLHSNDTFNVGIKSSLRKSVSLSNVLSSAYQPDLNGTFVKEISESNLDIDQISNCSQHSSEFMKGASSIPIRTPLKAETENVDRKKTHRRSMSAGHLHKMMKPNADKIGRAISPRIPRPTFKPTSFANKVINKKLKIGPTRVSTVSHKENIHPKSKSGPRTMKKFKSESTLPVYKRGGLNEHSTLR